MAQNYEMKIRRWNGQDYDVLLPVPASHASSHALTGNDPLAANTVGTEQIVAGAITAAKLGENSVTTEKIKNGAITAIKIGYGTDFPSNPTVGQLFLKKV